MKTKIITLAVILAFGISINSQNKFGISAGYHNPIGKLSAGGQTVSNGASGFFVGLFSEFKQSEKFTIQPEIGYGYFSEEGEGINQILASVLGKYYVADKVNINAGPFVDFVTNEGASNRFGIGIAVGAGFDLTDKLFAFTRYSFAVSNRNSETIQNIKVTSRIDIFQVGLGYRF
jgi:opacity protein-like surface antigen